MPKKRISANQQKSKKETKEKSKITHQDTPIDVSAVRKIFEKRVINRIAKTSGFVKRVRKMTPYSFFLSLSFGALKSSTVTLSSIVETMSGNISAAGVHERFSKEACDFFKNVYSFCFKKITSNRNSINVTKLNKFNHINIVDSSSWEIPVKLKEAFAGYKGAGCKVQVMIDYKTGIMNLLDITEQNYNDQKYTKQMDDYIEKDDLILTDLGYNIPTWLKKIDEKKGYFISRLNAFAMKLYLKKGKSFLAVDVLEIMKTVGTNDTMVEIECYGGNRKEKVKIRLVGMKVSEEIVNKRRRTLKRKAAKKCRKLTKRIIELSKWSFYITNIPKEKELTARDIVAFYSVRWNVELYFKQLKSVLCMHKTEVRKNEYRLQCEIIGKFIVGLFISYCYGMARSYLWEKKKTEISFEKTVKLFHRMGSGILLLLLLGSIRKIKEFTENLIYIVIQTCKKYRQKSRKNTLDMLIEGTIYGQYKYVKIKPSQLMCLT